MSKDDTETPDKTEQAAGEDNVSRFPDRKRAAQAMQQRDGETEGDGIEFLIDVDTHHSVLVVATDVDAAIAKVLSGEDDMSQTVVAHDVHVCAHSGISDNECDHAEEAE